MFIPDDSIPPPLLAALIGSDEGYSSEVKEYLGRNGRDYNLSVTSLNKPVQALILQKRYHNEIKVKPMDMWHSMMGQIVHWVLEKYASRSPEYFTEFRVGHDFRVGPNKRWVHVHGMMDLYHKPVKKIQDWKLTSANSMLYPKTSFEDQLNKLAYLMHSNGYEVLKLENIYLFPHLDKSMLQKPEYPKTHFKVVPVKLRDYAETEAAIYNKTERYLSELDKRDRDLTPCTDEERWVRGSYFKGYIRKKGTKKEPVGEFRTNATHNAETLVELKKMQSDEGIPDEDFKIVESKAEPKFCSYCPASRFCHQHQKYIREHQPWRIK